MKIIFKDGILLSPMKSRCMVALLIVLILNPNNASAQAPATYASGIGANFDYTITKLDGVVDDDFDYLAKGDTFNYRFIENLDNKTQDEMRDLLDQSTVIVNGQEYDLSDPSTYENATEEYQTRISLARVLTEELFITQLTMSKYEAQDGQIVIGDNVSENNYQTFIYDADTGVAISLTEVVDDLYRSYHLVIEGGIVAESLSLLPVDPIYIFIAILFLGTINKKKKLAI